MDPLTQLGVRDVRSNLSVVASAARHARLLPIRSATLHYNGPPVSVVGNLTAELRFVTKIDVQSHQARLGADSLQYHYVVLSDGAILYTRSVSLAAWHAGNHQANEGSLAVHLPIGGTQSPSPQQWSRTQELFGALGQLYGFGAQSVYGHNEWPRVNGIPTPSPVYRLLSKQSACPGPTLHALLAEYRSFIGFRVQVLVDLRVRQGPSTRYPIAGHLSAGSIVECDGAKDEGSGPWYHLKSGLGFFSGDLAYAIRTQ